jgi:uncharacterized protein YdhG (YjbR/CyaY superfamily)
MADNKTRPTGASVIEFMAAISDPGITGFSPRKQAMTIYIMPGFSRFETLMSKLGKYKTGKSCLYIRRLADVDETVLEQIIEESVGYMRAHYDTG